MTANIKITHIVLEDGDSHGLCGAQLEVDPAEEWHMCQDCFHLAMGIPEDSDAPT